MSEPKLQHYLPRSYLAHFANQYKRITVRRRGAEPVVMNITNAAAETHFYSVVLADDTRDTSAEKTLSSFEGVAQGSLGDLIKLKIPRSGSAARQALGLFLGLQMTRTPEHADLWLFPERAIEAQGGIDNVTQETMRTYLRDHHLGFEPDQAEVSGATDHVHALYNMGLPTKADRLDTMFQTAVKNFGPLLSELQWSIERCSKPILATCDRLPAILREYDEREEYKGFGILDAEELWFPVDVSTLLVLRRGGNESVTNVPPRLDSASLMDTWPVTATWLSFINQAPRTGSVSS